MIPRGSELWQRFPPVNPQKTYTSMDYVGQECANLL